MGSSVHLTGTRKESVILKTSQQKLPKLKQKEKKNWKKNGGKKKQIYIIKCQKENKEKIQQRKTFNIIMAKNFSKLQTETKPNIKKLKEYKVGLKKKKKVTWAYHI